MHQRRRAQLPSWRQVVLVLTPILLLPLALTTSKESRCGYVILTMAVYWVTEVMPIPVTALIPVFAFPLLGVLSTADLCLVYMKETTMMFLGVMTVALAVEYSNLHKRVALHVILLVGQSPRRLMAGIMLTTMFLSMWISNTASTAMMVPIVDSILQQLYQAHKKTSPAPLPNKDPQTAPHRMSKDAVAVTLETDDSSDNNCHDNHGFSSQETVACTDGAVEVKESTLPEAEPEMFAPPPNDECRRLCEMCYIATAFASSIGGTGSLTGTGSNLIVKGLLDEAFPGSNPINFATWLAYNMPGMLICTFLAWVWLQIMFVGFGKGSMLASDLETDAAISRQLKKKYNDMGPLTFHEGVVLSLFCSLVMLWLFRSPGFITGWGDLIRYAFPDVRIGSSTPALLVVILLFIIPKNPQFLREYDPNEVVKSKDNQACLTWSVVKNKFPWGVMLLLGGGFAMAEAADKSNMSVLITEQLRSLESLPKEVIALLACLVTTLVTEGATNQVIAAITLPVIKDLSLAIKVNPVYLMLPACLSCSFAFMLPVACPSNAIICGASKLKTVTLVKAGVVMKMVCVGVVLLMINTLGVVMFDLNRFPDWANSTLVVA